MLRLYGKEALCPAIVEADDDFPYVLKFRGAGQGKKALIAELIGGELARTLGLKVPEIVFMNLDDSFSKSEPDEEIQDLLKFSVGLNLGLHYLSGAITYDPLVSIADGFTASQVVLLDSVIMNVDRTHRNTNLLNWHKELWLIDHGASLYFHHAWENWKTLAQGTFPSIKDHVLLERATELEQARERMEANLTAADLEEIVSLIPEEWLEEETHTIAPPEKRAVYQEFLQTRLNNLSILTQEVAHVQQTRI